jgi:hypothetical protein
VGSNHPAIAVLERRIPWLVFVIFFPLIFVAIGGGGLWATWVGFKVEEEKAVQSISQSAASGKGLKFMIGFGLLFVAIGAAVFVPMTLVPAIKLGISLTWEETPCSIVSTRMRSWSTDDGTSYRADVLYTYNAGGREWRSNRVDFFSFLTSGRADARAVLDRHPRASTTTCWIDPRNPARSVLERQFRPKHFLGLIPLVFVLAGWAVANHGWKQLRTRRTPLGIVIEDDQDADAPVILKPEVGPVGKVGGALFFALFWNGIVSIFVWQAWKGWHAGDPDWFLTIFLGPFVLVGIASFFLVAYFLLSLANPRPRLTLTPSRPRLGDQLRLEWKFTGRAEREVFASFDLADTSNDWEIPQGTVEIEVPADTMHSFEAENNKIIWEIKVEGEIEKWPDVGQNFSIAIRPMRVENV